MELREQIEEIIKKIRKDIAKEAKIRDENIYKNDYNSISEFYSSYGKIDAYCKINLLLNEVLENERRKQDIL